MALKELENTQTDLLNLIGGVTGGIDDLTTAIKSYIGNQIGVSASDLEKKIEAGDEKVKELLGANFDKFKAFALIVDKWDGEEDGTFNPQQTLLEIAGNITTNVTAIGVNEQSIIDLDALLKKEVSDRTKQGESLTTAIANAKKIASDLISNMEKTVQSLADRLGLAENKINDLVDSINTLGTSLRNIGDELVTSTAKFAVADDSNAV